MRRLFAYTIAGILVVLVVTMALFLYEVQDVQTSPEQETSCASLYYERPAAINLVFLGQRTEAERAVDFFLKTEPFAEQPAFNFYFVENFVPTCTRYKDIALFCSSRALLKAASVCPHDYVVVYEQAPALIRSSSYQNVLSLNTNHPTSVLTHEFGHAFVALAEEYVPAELPVGQPNCVARCEQFGGKEDGCFIGCSKDALYRSIENGVMRTLASNAYGSFNTFVIAEKIQEYQKRRSKSTGIVGNVITQDACHSSHALLVGIADAEIVSIDVLEESCAAGTLSTSEVQVTITDAEGIENRVSVSAPTLFTDGPDEATSELSGETVLQPIVEQYVSLPLADTAQDITISLAEQGMQIDSVIFRGAASRPCEVL